MNLAKKSHPGLRSALLGSVALLSVAASATGAFAAAAAAAASTTGAAASTDTGSTLQEIQVTAQKREQNLQDVPVAVTAVTHDTLQANRVVNVMSLNGLAPGLIAKANAGALGSPSYNLRGIFATASAPGQDQALSSYLDGVYVGGIRGAVFDLPDIERVEVLRGPQGTLFGRNSIIGAISIVTRDPTGAFHVHQDLTGGNEGQFRSRTSIDLPQLGPFSAYVTYVHDQRDGDIRNLGAGTTFDRTNPFSNIGGVSSSPARLGGHNNNDIFVAIKFAPTDNFTITNKFDWSESHYVPEARGSLALNPANATAGFLLSDIVAFQPAGGGPYGPFAFASYQRPDAVNNAWAQQSYSRALGDNITMVWRPTDNLTIKNITAYRNALVYGISDIMGVDGLEAGPVGAAIFGGSASDYFIGYEGQSYGKYWQFSDEAQLNYQSKFLTLTTGAIYFHANEQASGLPGFNPNPAFTTTTSNLLLRTAGNIQDGIAITESYAAYAQFEFHLTPKLDVDLGGRVTDDKKHGSFLTGGTFVGNAQAGQILNVTGPGLPPLQDALYSFGKTKLTYSIGANYKLTDDVMVYGKFSTGFLSGGSVGALAYAPETVSSWEGGIKSEWFDRRLRANLSIWSADYSHLQAANSGSNIKPVPSPISVVVIDAGQLKARGVELEVAAVPIEGLTLGGQISYTHGTDVNPNPVLTGGDPYAYINPNWVANVSAEYKTQPLFNDAYMTFRVDANYVGSARNSPDLLFGTAASVGGSTAAFAPFLNFPGTWLVNGRIALQNIKFQNNVNLQVALWSKNLLDNKNPIYVLPFGNIEMDTSWQPARTFGVDVSLDF